MATGKSFNHKKKSHPGAFPKESEMKKPKNNINDEDSSVTRLAFTDRD